MTDPANLQARVEALEGVLARRVSRRGWAGGVLLALGGLLLAGLISGNLWLMQQQFARRDAESREHLFWVLCHSEIPSARQEAFLKLAVLGNREWRSARLERLTFENLELPGIDLQQADFLESDLAGANLRGAILAGSNFRLVDFTGANLSGVEAANAFFEKAVLNGVNFREANLRGARIELAKIREANFVMARMGGAFLPMSDLTGSDLTGADLSGAFLDSAVLKDTNLALTQLAGARLGDVDFSGSNWWRARGLTTDQIDELLDSFPPPEDANSSRRQDFLLWLQSRENLQKSAAGGAEGP